MHPVDLWFFKVDEWEAILQKPKIEVIRAVNKFKKIDSTFTFIAPSTRKRRRQDDSQKLPKCILKNIVGPTGIGVCLPLYFSEAYRAVLNALAGILPLDIKVNLFGFAHAMILVAVCYKHDNLCWILLNRMNYKFYIASHFVADALHLFGKNRQRLQFPDDRKWHRQGINEIMTLSIDANARNRKTITRMNTLPKSVLRYNNSVQGFYEITEFLRCVGSHGNFLNKFTRKQLPPKGFSVPNEDLCQFASGWKVFKKTKENDQCKAGCQCCNVNVVKCDNLQDTVINLIKAVPSSLDQKAGQVFETHFATFIQFIKENPDLSFYPNQDA